jgi:predicted nucleotidyltransferase
MPEPFSSSVEVRFIDRDQVIRDLRAAVAEAKRTYPEIVKVLLFGSLVDGTWTADSDADLMIVVRKDFADFFESCRYQIYTSAIPIDSLVYSEADFEKLSGDPESFVARNLATAVEL